MLLLLPLAGCAVAYALVEPERVSIGEAFTVEPRMAWNRIGETLAKGPVVVWTAEGPQLDSLYFFPGVEDGEPLLEAVGQPGRAAAGETDALPRFRRDMSANAIMELFEATMVRLTGSVVAASTNLRPVQFAGVPGFRFDFGYTTKDELERSGFVVGAVRDEKLYMIFFQGTRIYHFGKYREEAEHIIASASFI